MIKVKFIDNLSYQTYPLIGNDYIEISEEELSQIGKTLQYRNGQLIPYFPQKDNSDLINKNILRLEELRKDFEQDRLGLVVPNLEVKKQEYIHLLQEVRILQGKEPREVKTTTNIG